MILYEIVSASARGRRFILAAPGEDITPLLHTGEHVESVADVNEFLGGELSITDEARFPLADLREDFSLKETLRRFEASLIYRALRKTGGVVTRAAKMLGFRHYGSLQHLLNTRHKALQPARTPVVRRKRGLEAAKAEKSQQRPGKDKRRGS
jgi:hypothetical protein